MTEWWTPAQAGIIGAIVGGGGGTLLGLLGAAAGVLVPRNKGHAWIPPLFLAVGILGVLALAVGVVALAQGQPWHVWMIPVQIGLLAAILGFVLRMVIMRVYTHHEHRRLDAAALRNA